MHAHEGAMQARLDCAWSHAEAFRHGRERQVGPEMEDDDLALARRELAQEMERLIAVEQVAEWVRDPQAGIGFEFDELDPSAAAEAIAAGVDEDPVEPGLESIDVAQAV